MASNEERLKILDMLQNGVISAEQAAQLLEALSQSNEERKPTGPFGPVPPTRRSGKFFRVRITDTDSGKTRVNVRIPVGLVNAGVKMGMKFSPEIEGIDPDMLQSFLESGEIGQIVDIYDDDDGEHVEVFIE